ncbi:ABC transporter ATP-binding protein [Geosporobacter ferrireducens]|uniref:ABC transporter domain-containing protein n=1 Tax=Geosporobacter ferrireducens TaxID=1424294 RepID=A0A1D8GG92_9FIRM|nr:ATP-binding cassette domain-containing protein [Geosporobacter ferrireducens]AOT69931.1 hypothetical protein Gferi_10255 [Geosporobacter ferrireducens]
MEVFKIQDLTYYYPRQEKAALKNIQLTLREGEFILLLGKSGSGKSTLGRVFNRIVPEFYGGKIAGTIESSASVGMVFQDPEKQLVMDQVEREIAFGLENIGEEYATMRKKVLETLSFLNMWDIRDKKNYELSGGQKQKVAIGATLSMGYRFLVLDEPTSQLDPTTAEEVLQIIKRLNEELGYTIVLIEQRIDRCFHLADRILFMEEGELVFDGAPNRFCHWNALHQKKFLPSIADFFVKLGIREIPLTIKSGRRELHRLLGKENPAMQIPSGKHPNAKEIISLQKLSFRYENGKKALKEIDLKVSEGEVLAIMGENGSGKTTLLKNICGLVKPTHGKTEIRGTIGYLSQNPNDYLFNDTVYEELKFTLDNKKIKDYSRIDKILKALDIEIYKEKNPRDLSGGEKQRVALASILVMEPEIILLDEPTRGLDRELKERMGNIIADLKGQGKTVLIVTHDVEFVSKFCDQVCLMFDGSIAQLGGKYEVLTSGVYYTTQMNKLFKGRYDRILTQEDALYAVNPLLKKGVM